MKINYNATGLNRKSLVGAISKILNIPAKYLGMPTAAYEIGNYTIDKSGALTGDGSVDDTNNSELLKALNECGYIGEVADRGNTEPGSRRYRAELGDLETPDRMEVFSANDDDDALRQAYDYAVDKVVLLELHELDEDYNILRSVDIPRYSDRLVIEMPIDDFTETAISNLIKLVDAKAPLLKAALGADDLPIVQTADTLRFPWFWDEKILTSDEVTAYSTLISLLCKTAKEKKRVTAKEKPVEGSSKYAMRCFLLSLGFIGDEYKVSRRILLSRLEGSAAWKNGERKRPDNASATDIDVENI